MAVRATEDNGERVCSTLFPSADLSFLLHAACARVSAEIDGAAREIGLTDARDWFVLAVLDGGEKHTQLELSRMVCVDKTTLISVIDRLEQRGFVQRTIDPADRRVRIPRITAAGRRVCAKFAAARDEVESRVFDGIEPGRRALLLELLGQVAEREPAGV
ncbi:MarR family winged helix-turn-helix transcriptional regulator [Amycolatopsis pithecellobii]|uniref:MarR family transcriptional regulator n=1 Tax=Amycolatopsis pithecellobii TaxID=664692 RepID=A0A6N7YJD6_9PSEU|nr:MarR family transcriptional regulator [Amycolatopsis pithecellobii]MTD53007.1 MarR family transcriptional regulator [Amycolatopsis pithecellobii]